MMKADDRTEKKEASLPMLSGLLEAWP